MHERAGAVLQEGRLWVQVDPAKEEEGGSSSDTWARGVPVVWAFAHREETRKRG